MNKTIQQGEPGVVDQAKQTAAHVADQAKAQVTNQIDAKKDSAVQTMGTVANVLRETGGKLKEAGPLADVAERAAEGIERVAGFVRTRDIGDLATEVERFARREPALFLGAALAVGLLGGRFLKSSARRREEAFDDQWGYEEHDQDDVRFRAETRPITQGSPQGTRVNTLRMGSELGAASTSDPGRRF